MAKHISISAGAPVEIINVTSNKLSPLISKCQIKVCYVGDEPNRNGSIITKEAAKRDLAPSLQGAPIVGFFNEATNDFEGHNREMEIVDGELKFNDTTKPYGFVDLNAKVWFQKFIDDGVEHEYLMTEGYLWTGQYPEAQRILEHGNNQSMELENVDGAWTVNANKDVEFFIINEAVISKLCILGENVEPCFEGSSITKVQFSFDESFKDTWTQMVHQVYDLIKKEESPVEDNIQEVVETVEEETPVIEEEVAVAEEEVVTEEEVVEEALVAEEETVEEVIEEEENPAAEEEVTEEAVEEEKIEEAEDEVEEIATAEEEVVSEETYSLDNIPEYVELKAQYDSLQVAFAALQNEAESLKEFKHQAEKKQKEEMIDSFYMLSDADKKEVRENIDSYSLSDIEAKLSIICVRNKVNFSLETETVSKPSVYTDIEIDDSSMPAWIKKLQNYNAKK